MLQSILLAGAVLTGALVPLQLAFNGQLGIALKGPFVASFFVFLTGLVATGLVLLATRMPFPALSDLRAVPMTAWLGGLIATIYIVAIVFLVPRLGVGTSAVLIIAGQLMTALLLDHLGAFGAQQVTISIGRLAGAGLVIAGAVLIRST
ncbi:MAG: DMT family transporter [Pseudomonadota bacterium]